MFLNSSLHLSPRFPQLFFVFVFHVRQLFFTLVSQVPWTVLCICPPCSSTLLYTCLPGSLNCSLYLPSMFVNSSLHLSPRFPQLFFKCVFHVPPTVSALGSSATAKALGRTGMLSSEILWGTWLVPQKKFFGGLLQMFFSSYMSLSFIPSSEANGWSFRKGSLVPVAVLLYSLSPNLFAGAKGCCFRKASYLWLLIFTLLTFLVTGGLWQNSWANECLVHTPLSFNLVAYLERSHKLNLRGMFGAR